MDIIYQGTNPPTSLSGVPLSTGHTEAQVRAIWDIGKAQSNDFTIIIQDGTARKYYAPLPGVSTPVARVLSKTQFMDHGYAQLGGGTVGIRRYGKIMKDAKASNDDGVSATLDRYNAAQTIEKANAAIFIAMLLSAAIVTQAESDAVLNNWPTT